MDLFARKPVRRWIRIAAAACVVAIAILSLTPREHMVRTSLGGHTEHVIAYLICAWFCLLTCNAWRHRLIIYSLLLAYAGLLEFLQSMVPGRHSGFDDFIFSAAGATAGALAAILMGRKPA
jgi:VanZ family protein